MDYYNKDRYQWKLNRLTPKQYGDMLRNKNKKDGRSKPEQPPLNLLIKY